MRISRAYTHDTPPRVQHFSAFHVEPVKNGQTVFLRYWRTKNNPEEDDVSLIIDYSL